MLNDTVESMCREAIEEYLAISYHCITARKANGGAYGYPAILLLFSIVDALSSYAGYPKHSFGALKDIFPELSKTHVAHLKNWYRNLVAHQAIIMPGTVMSVELPGSAIEFNAAGEPTHVRLLPFWAAVEEYWRTKGSGNVAPSFRQEKTPKAPPALIVVQDASTVSTVSTHMPNASSVYINMKPSAPKRQD